MPRRTNPFQKLTTSIMAVFFEPEFKVVESVLVRNATTGAVRELDILIYHHKNPNRNILVECRDHNRKQDVQWIDQLEGKAKRLNFKNVIAVSSSGFTGPATAEASERDIRTLHLRQAEEMDWRRWMFGLDTFGVNIESDLIVKDVRLGVPPNLVSTLPKEMNFSNVYLVDTKKKVKVLLTDWIAGFRKDAKIKAQLAQRDANDAINHYTYTIPCDPGIGFVVGLEERIIPLLEVSISVDSIRAEYSVPLKHYDAGGERIHVGQSKILGRDTKLVLHETDGHLKVMLEQLVERPGTDAPNSNESKPDINGKSESNI